MVENADRLIGRDEIMRVAWPGTFVTEDSITQCRASYGEVLSMAGSHEAGVAELRVGRSAKVRRPPP